MSRESGLLSEGAPIAVLEAVGFNSLVCEPEKEEKAINNIRIQVKAPIRIFTTIGLKRNGSLKPHVDFTLSV